MTALLAQTEVTYPMLDMNRVLIPKPGGRCAGPEPSAACISDTTVFIGFGS